MSIDERLERLLKSCEALHASLLAEKAEHRQRQERTGQARQALGAAIAAYIDALNGNGDEQAQ